MTNRNRKPRRYKKKSRKSGATIKALTKSGESRSLLLRKVAGRGFFFRSEWEYHYALYLQMLLEQDKIKAWGYESKIFRFPVPRNRKSRYYKPDFDLTLLDDSIVFHEVKGKWYRKGWQHIQNMKRFFPKVKVEVIREERYNECKREADRYYLNKPKIELPK